MKKNLLVLLWAVFCVNSYAMSEQEWVEPTDHRLTILGDVDFDGFADELFIEDSKLIMASMKGVYKTKTLLEDLPRGIRGYALMNMNQGGFELPDLAFIAHDGVYVATHDGRTFRRAKLWLYLGEDDDWDVIFRDLDGDGRTDLRVIGSEMAGDYRSTGGRFFPMVEALNLEVWRDASGSLVRVLASSLDRNFPHLFSDGHLNRIKAPYLVPDWVLEVNLIQYRFENGEESQLPQLSLVQLSSNWEDDSRHFDWLDGQIQRRYGITLGDDTLYLESPPEDEDDCDDIENCP